jgi:hypothetical protein
VRQFDGFTLSVAVSDEQNRFTLFRRHLANGRMGDRSSVLPSHGSGEQADVSKRRISDVASRWHHFREGHMNRNLLSQNFSLLRRIENGLR